MNRPDLLDKLNRATDRAATVVIARGFPIQVSSKSTLIGNTVVTRNGLGLYDIVKAPDKKLYENISVFDVAIIIAQKYNSGEFSAIRKILMLEQKYSKHHMDMVHYLNCLKGAQKRRDIERMSILEDKFQVAEILAKHARDSISIFKRVK